MAVEHACPLHATNNNQSAIYQDQAMGVLAEDGLDQPDLHPKIRRLYSPISLITSLVPNHIRLDTSGLNPLWMTKDRLEQFKAFYPDTFKKNLSTSSKADMPSTYSKVVGKPKQEVTDEEEATYVSGDNWSAC